MVQIGLRVPPPLRERLLSLAERERRSLNGQVLQLIDEALTARAPDEAPPKATAKRARAKG